MALLFLGNLSYQATEEDVRTVFAACGTVAEVQLAKDRETGRPRGFGFVEMPDFEQARKAIAGVNRQSIAGRSVKVNEARPREDGPSL